MYRQIYLLLPHHESLESDKISKYKKRWETEIGKKCYDFIIDKIKKGGGEDFLQWEFEKGTYLNRIMENQWDLKGIKIWQLNIHFPSVDNFVGIDFSYTEFWHCKFKNATFSSVYFGFSNFHNFEFEFCLFGFTNFYCVKFEKVKFKNCTFIEHNYFINCEFINCEFDNFFTEKNLFIDCLFNVNTKVKNISIKPIHNFSVKLEKKNLPDIYKGIKDSYLAGEVFGKYREYFFKQKEAETQYIKSGISKLGSYLLKNLTGYGVKPLYTLRSLITIIVIFTLIYSIKFPLSDSILMSLSSLTTMGEVPNICPYNFIYILESAIGICLFALFITILANIWFSEK